MHQLLAQEKPTSPLREQDSFITKEAVCTTCAMHYMLQTYAWLHRAYSMRKLRYQQGKLKNECRITNYVRHCEQKEWGEAKQRINGNNFYLGGGSFPPKTGH